MSLFSQFQEWENLKLMASIDENLKKLAHQEKIIAELKVRSEALDNGLVAFDIISDEGKFLYANKAYLKLWGYESLEEIIGTSPAEHCANPETPIQIITRLKQTGECDIEFLAKRKDETVFMVHMWARLAHDQDGKEIYPTTSIDITAQKVAEQEIRYQSHLNQTVADNAFSCLFILDKHGFPTFMNPAAIKVTGYSSLDEIKDRPLHYAIHWKKPDGSLYPMEECPIDKAQSKLKAVQNQEENFCTKEGKLFPVSYSLAPLEKNGEVIGSVLEFRDISQQKEIEQELKAAIKSRDVFLSIASHELKTPLTSLRLQAQMHTRRLAKGKNELTRPEELQAYLKEQIKHIDRIARLVEDMLDISRINTGSFSIQLKEFDLVPLAREVSDRYVADGMDVSLESPASLKVNWDILRIEQVLENLFSNAVRYGQGKPIKFKLEQIDDYSRIAITDQGPGIRKDDQERIFNRFERAISANEVSGLGLGLSIVKEIIEGHRGSVKVESKPGAGASFIIELPLHPNPQN